MAPPKQTRIIIPLVGISSGNQQPRAVYDEASHKILSAAGAVSTMRASHVEAGKDLGQAALTVLANDAATPYAQWDNSSLERPYRIRDEYAECWFADMTPTGHDIVLGPYQPASRDLALQEEVAWLQEHNIPTCAACTASQHNQTRNDTCNSPSESS